MHPLYLNQLIVIKNLWSGIIMRYVCGHSPFSTLFWWLAGAIFDREEEGYLH